MLDLHDKSAIVRYIKGPTMLMGSGHYFDFLSPETSRITDEDIAWGLAGTNRFRAQTVSQVSGKRCFYSVAEHCIRGSYVIEPDLAYLFLMHELGEVPWGDIITPQKVFVPELDRLERRSLRSLARHRRLDFALHWDAIKRVDLIMLATERRDLMPPTTEQWEILDRFDPLPERIEHPDPNKELVAERFLARMRELRDSSTSA